MNFGCGSGAAFPPLPEDVESLLNEKGVVLKNTATCGTAGIMAPGLPSFQSIDFMLSIDSVYLNAHGGQPWN